MKKIIVSLIAVFGMLLAAAVAAAPVARVSALTSSVWLQQDDNTRKLSASDELFVGDSIVTGENGRAEIRLLPDLVVRVYPGTEIGIQPGGQPEETAGSGSAALYLHLGKLCVKTGPPSSSGRHFVLKVTDSMIAVIHQSAHICVSRTEGMSAIRLLQGSVQLTNSIDPSIVVLSEAGIEYSQSDDGSYQLLPPSNPDTIGETDTEPFINASEIESGITRTEIEAAEEKPAVSINAETSEPETPSDVNGYIYTVYLFSTRSEEVAEQVNQKLRQAGHDSRILVNENVSPIRYRIAVPGFTSRQSAKEFAASIVGKLGIRDTWIGKDRPGSEQ